VPDTLFYLQAEAGGAASRAAKDNKNLAETEAPPTIFSGKPYSSWKSLVNAVIRDSKGSQLPNVALNQGNYRFSYPDAKSGAAYSGIAAKAEKFQVMVGPKTSDIDLQPLYVNMVDLSGFPAPGSPNMVIAYIASLNCDLDGKLMKNGNVMASLLMSRGQFAAMQMGPISVRAPAQSEAALQKELGRLQSIWLRNNPNDPNRLPSVEIRVTSPPQSPQK